MIEPARSKWPNQSTRKWDCRDVKSRLSSESRGRYGVSLSLSQKHSLPHRSTRVLLASHRRHFLSLLCGPPCGGVRSSSTDCTALLFRAFRAHLYIFRSSLFLSLFLPHRLSSMAPSLLPSGFPCSLSPSSSFSLFYLAMSMADSSSTL